MVVLKESDWSCCNTPASFSNIISASPVPPSKVIALLAAYVNKPNTLKVFIHVKEKFLEEKTQDFSRSAMDQITINSDVNIEYIYKYLQKNLVNNSDECLLEL